MLERSAAASIPNVPAWFVDLVDVTPQTGEATIMRGWQQAARVEVTSDPIFAVQRLWDNTLGNLLWMLSCSLASNRRYSAAAQNCCAHSITWQNNPKLLLVASF